MARQMKRLKKVNSIEEIPDFASEAEEAEFWSTHSLGEALLDQMEPIPESELSPDIRRTRPVSVRLGEDVVERLESLARTRNITLQALVRGFIVDGLTREEIREGSVPRAANSSLRSD
jgi:hypothetical protein